jgi:hypothetical protein
MKPLIALSIILYLLNIDSSFAQGIDVLFHYDSSLDMESARRFLFTEKLDLGQNLPNSFSTDSCSDIIYKAIDAFNAQIVIYSLDRYLLRSHTFDRGVGRLTIWGSHFATGTYVYTLVVKDRMIARRKLIVNSG